MLLGILRGSRIAESSSRSARICFSPSQSHKQWNYLLSAVVKTKFQRPSWNYSFFFGTSMELLRNYFRLVLQSILMP